MNDECQDSRVTNKLQVYRELVCKDSEDWHLLFGLVFALVPGLLEPYVYLYT